MVISVLDHSATHSAKYAVDRHTSGNETQNCYLSRKVQVDKDQEKAQSEKDSHSKNRGGKKPN